MARLLSGFVENSSFAPLRNFTVRIVGTNISTLTNQEGVFTLLDVPAGSVTIEADPSTSAAAWAFPQSYSRQINVTAGRDNLLSESFLFGSGTSGGVPLFGGYAITGKVLDADSNQPIPNVSVRESNQATATDAAGGFVLRNLSASPFIKYRLNFSFLSPDGTISRAVAMGETSLAVGVVNFPVGGGQTNFKVGLVNRDPLLLTPTSITMNVNEVKDVVIFVDDPDPNENLQIAVSGPQGISIIPGAGGAYTIRLAPKSSGMSTVKVTVTDSKGSVTARDIPLTVLAPNSAPTLSVQGAQIINPGQHLTFDVFAFNPDAAQRITLSATNLPMGASFFSPSRTGSLTGFFSWTPATNQIGTYTITFTATDNGSPPLSDSKAVVITVVPRAPDIQWVRAGNSGLPQGKNIEALVAIDGQLFGSILGGGVFKSDDNGNTWNAVNNGLLDLNVASIDVVGTRLLAFYRNDTIVTRIVVSDDFGTTWREVNTEIQNLNFKNFYRGKNPIVSGNDLFGLTVSGQVLRSVDKGLTWTIYANNAPVRGSDLYKLAASDDVVYILGSGASGPNTLCIWDGNHWQSRIYNSDILTDVGANGPSVFIWSNRGFDISSDKGQTWNMSSYKAAQSGFTVSEYGFAFGNGLVFALMNNLGYGIVLASSNNGANFQDFSKGLRPDGTSAAKSVSQLLVKGKRVFAVTNDGIYVIDLL